MPANTKLIRWFDLLAALLRRRYAVSFAELSRDVPAYAHKGAASDTLLRMFERDKDELRNAGIAIETVTSGDGDASEYRLPAKSFYLPYLMLSESDGSTVPHARKVTGVRRPTGPGYGSLPTLAVLPDEIVMLRRAAERVRMLDEPQLELDAVRALRKLRHDLPEELAVTAVPNATELTSPFTALHDAVQRRKHVTFTYHSIGRGATDARTVEPYGLVYLTGKWYLVAFDRAAGGQRHFRTSRMQNVRVNVKAPTTPDFSIPTDFDLRAHARSRHAWELGTGDVEPIDVEFISAHGDISVALDLGEPIAGHEPLMHAPTAPTAPTASASQPAPARRRFAVRRRDTFLRWLLAFGGDVRPVAPPDVVDDWRSLVRSAYQVHANAEVSA